MGGKFHLRLNNGKRPIANKETIEASRAGGKSASGITGGALSRKAAGAFQAKCLALVCDRLGNSVLVSGTIRGHGV
ncbi:2114_t:CDS:2 [Ambispora leptoticha]|uniref:2114_t:CDS:1 n=1 Tax=Ambispora leptoticha TaxID=144679 RepID=A0A9N9DNC2_9GLOM|nr:2114_t:CDS:2 [Ambispora leptoticha]